MGDLVRIIVWGAILHAIICSLTLGLVAFLIVNFFFIQFRKEK